MNKLTLEDFIIRATNNGLKWDEQQVLLKEAGWPEDIIQSEYNKFYQVSAKIAVPKYSIKSSFGGFALNAFIFLTLYLIIYNTTDLCYDMVDYIFETGFSSLENIKWNISIIITSIPFYFFTNYIAVKRQFIFDSSRIKIIYLTLFIAAVIGIGTVCGIVYAVLFGDNRIQDFIKLLITFLFSGIAFLYFYLSLKAIKRVIDLR
ncbi:MAG: hypothetical protein K1X44_01850 [Alphaproteobacteria bacterium]|nr:hypothetical protein [Alphaproteobacteria bacterium]